MKLKEFISVPRYKDLDKTGRIFYVISVLLPICFLLIFLYLYIQPFGYKKDTSNTLESIEDGKNGLYLTNLSFIYSDDQKDVSSLIDGVLILNYKPKSNDTRINVDIKLNGENIYLIPKDLKDEDVLDIWDYELNLEDISFKGMSSILLDNYRVKDSDLITINLNFLPNWNNKSYPQLLLKYKNLRIILNEGNIQVRVDRLIDNSLVSYNTFYYLDSKEIKKDIDLVVTYKKVSEDTNGYLEMYVNSKFGDRVTIPTDQRLFDENVYTNENIVIWSEELIKDLSQEFISLGQESFVEDLLEGLSPELKNSINIQKYYANLLQPEPEKEIPYTNSYWGAWEDYLNKEDNNYSSLTQIFYPKDFYNYFKGKINIIKIGYEYPFKLKTSDTLKSIDAPFTFFVYGNNGTLENINLTISKEPLWKR